MVKNSKTNKNNNNSNLCWNTLALMLVFAISISIGYLMYSCDSKGRNNKKTNDLNNKYKNTDQNKEKEEIQKKVDEVNSLIINSDKVIKELEKFSDLNNIQGKFKLDLENNDNHREYNAYFIDNPIDCIEKKISAQADHNEVNAQKSMIAYGNNLKGYIEEINLDLIQFLQKSYKDAHRMNIERQVDLYDIDTLPGKFM